MTWIRNPFFHTKAVAPAPATDEDSEAQNAPAPEAAADPPLLQLQQPTAKLTGYQFFYIFILDGLGAMILSGGINFAIAYAMYATSNGAKYPIRLFQLPNTLAGDAAVTIIVQCIITWLIELILVNRDLKSGHLPPIGFVPQPENKILRWFLFLDRTREAVEPGTIAHWAVFLYSQVLRAFIVAVLSFCLLWGPSVGILTAVGTRSGGDWVFGQTWAPQVFKLLLGGILALITTPPMAAFWLIRAGWALTTNQAAVGGVAP